MEGDASLSIGEIVVQAQLRIVVAVLKMIRDLLQGALAALPPSAQEMDPQADGWIPVFFSPGRMKMFRGWLDEGFARAGRSASTFD
ncbi:MAG TPA: hypothetical protein VLV54_18850, partial [Thermoanaerobaculia bacterium]|nr:hypothetical protein [Thermoanaerobaculia bacterium]